MTTAYELRPTYFLDVGVDDEYRPLLRSRHIRHPQRVVVRFSTGATVDTGALCYSDIDTATRGYRSCRSDRVVLASFKPERVEMVRNLILLMSDDLVSGLAPETVVTKYRHFCVFVRWWNAAGLGNALNSEVVAIEAIDGYIRHLRERVARSDGISVNTAAHMQNPVVEVLEELLGVEDLARGLNLLRYDKRLTIPTSPPEESSQGRVLDLCTHTFAGLSHLVLEKAAYPYPLRVPEYLRYPSETLWVFPCSMWVCPPTANRYQTTSRKHQLAYDFAAGTILAPEELGRRLKTAPPWSTRQTVQCAHRQVAKANADFTHVRRLAAGVVAVKAFVLLFLAQTSMNWAQIVSLEWSDDFTVESSTQGFRTIKPRAKGKAVSFELPIAFMPFFRRFLELRKYLLQGQSSELLLFFLGGAGAPRATKIAKTACGIYKTLLVLDPSLPKVTPREWRAAKSDWLVRYTDVKTAALVLQTSEDSVRRSYSEGSESRAMEEVGRFLHSVSQMVSQSSGDVDGGVQHALNNCQHESPAPQSNAPVTADCKVPEGCLFCHHFRIHPEAKDTRKLVSCRHTLQQTSFIVGSEERHQRVILPTIVRIDALLDEVAKHNAVMVQTIIREVDEEGELDPYWSARLDVLKLLEPA